MTFGERLKDIRLNRNMTQDQLALAINYERQAISMYENGHREPRVTTIGLLSEALEVTTDYLIKGVK